MKQGPETFAENVRAALLDSHLQSAVKNFTSKFVARRNAATAELSYWEQLRSRAHAIKKQTIDHLDTYLEQFSTHAAETGAHVYWAQTAADACGYIVELAHARGLRRVVKSKSMATEEIGLNHALEVGQIEVVETDLGEYIVQLLNETPSHILAPAIHRTRSDVARLFADKLGIEYTEEVEVLTAAARTALRDKFLKADMGVTGANFGIAETGSVVVVENEGNGRMATSLPRIHVVLIGIEKLIPRLEDLDLFLTVLTRSATGQKISTYVSVISGVKKSEWDEGPEELHIVVLDNGRTRILKDPVQRQSLYCIRCGACLNVCPVYQQIGGHAYGWVYPGPIGALITPQLLGVDRARDLPFASSLCGACKDVCPVKINIPDLLLDARHKVKSHTASAACSPFLERAAMGIFSLVMRRTVLYRLSGRIGRMLQRGSVDGGFLKGIALRAIAPWTRTRDFPALAPRCFRELWRDELEGWGE